MGYFSMPNGTSEEDYIDAAIENLKLYKETKKLYEHDYAFLSRLSKGFIDEALQIGKGEVFCLNNKKASENG